MNPLSSLRLFFALFIVFSALSCARQVDRVAPFRVRPDSTEAGSLKGPFTGRVVDAVTGDPVAGALVYANWSYEHYDDMSQPAGFIEKVSSTDANGRYLIEAAKIGGQRRLVDAQLVVYKRGYVAYRSNRRFVDFGPRLDFAQKQNQIELRRWRAGQSHARHVRFVGGGSALLSLTAWERSEAAEELSGSGKAPAMTSDFLADLSEERLVAAQLLGEAEIKEITGFDGSFETGPLNDEADTQTYSSQHFKALGQPELYDLALRLWRLDETSASKRFTELADTLPGVTRDNAIADESLLAVEGDIQGVAFLDKKRSLVVLLTCGKAQCTELGVIKELAQKVLENINEVMPVKGAMP